MDPEVSGERVPDFYTPSRVRLYYKIISDLRNCNKITRKQMPENIKKELAKKAKEYGEYKAYEFNHVYNESNRAFNIKIQAMRAWWFLPEHLFHEIASDTHKSNTESMKGFTTEDLYIEQIMEMYPREHTEKNWKWLLHLVMRFQNLLLICQLKKNKIKEKKMIIQNQRKRRKRRKRRMKVKKKQRNR